VVFNQSQGLGWRRGSGGVVVDPRMGGQEGCTMDISISQIVVMGVMMLSVTCVTYVTETHFFLVKGTLTHLG